MDVSLEFRSRLHELKRFSHERSLKRKGDGVLVAFDDDSDDRPRYRTKKETNVKLDLSLAAAKLSRRLGGVKREIKLLDSLIGKSRSLRKRSSRGGKSREVHTSDEVDSALPQNGSNNKSQSQPSNLLSSSLKASDNKFMLSLEAATSLLSPSSGRSSIPSLATTPHLGDSKAGALADDQDRLRANLVPNNKPEAAAPMSPRTKYSAHLTAKVKNMVNLLMQLDSKAMHTIRREFSARGWELNSYDFVTLLQSYLQTQSENEEEDEEATNANIDALSEMFNEIDVNGDATMEWDEFTAHLVELASAYYGDFLEDNVPHYTYELIEDATHHDYHCDYIRFIPEIGKMVVFERGSRRFKLYQSNLTCSHVVRGHRGSLLAVEYLPEHKLLVTSSEDKTMIFWSTARHNFMSQTMQWSTKRSMVSLKWIDRFLFSADTTGTIAAWSIERAEQKFVLKGHTDIVMALCPLTTGYFTSASLDGTIRIWDSHHMECTAVLKGHDKGVLYLTYSHDYEILCSGGLDNYVLVWSPAVSNHIMELKLDERVHVVNLHIAKGSPELIIGDNTGTFSIYDVRSFAQIQQFTVPKLSAPNIGCFTSDTARGTITACGEKLHLFKRTSGVKSNIADDHPIVFACYNPTSMTFLTAAGRGIKIWDALTGKLERADPQCMPSTITSMCLDDRKRRLIVGDHEGNVRVLNYSNGAHMKDLTRHSSEVSQVLFCNQRGEKDPKQILTASWDGSIVSHHDKMALKQTVMRKLTDYKTDVSCMKVSSEWGVIAVGAVDRTLSLYEWGMGPLLGKFFLRAPACSMAFVEGFPLLVVSDDSGSLYMFHCQAPFELLQESVFVNRRPDNNNKVSSILGMSFCPSDYSLVTIDDGGFLKRWLLKREVLNKHKAKKEVTNWATYSAVRRAPNAQHLVAEEAKLVLSAQASPRHQSPLSRRSNRSSRRASRDADPKMNILSPASQKRISARGDRRKTNNLVTALDITEDMVAAEGLDLPAGVVFSAKDSRKPLSQPSSAAPTARDRFISSKPDRYVRAHKYSASLQVIPKKETGTYPVVITWSHDGSVYLWDATTLEKVGSLIQGHNNRHPQRTEKWGLNLNLTQYQKREALLLAQAIAEPEVPPVLHSRPMTPEDHPRARGFEDLDELMQAKKNQMMKQDTFHLTSVEHNDKSKHGNQRNEFAQPVLLLSKDIGGLQFESKGPSLLRKVETGYNHEHIDADDNRATLPTISGMGSSKSAASLHQQQARAAQVAEKRMLRAQSTAILERLNPRKAYWNKTDKSKTDISNTLQAGRHRLRMNKGQLSAARALEETMQRNVTQNNFGGMRKQGMYYYANM